MAARSPPSASSSSFSRPAQAAAMAAGLVAAGSAAYWMYSAIRRRQLAKAIGFSRAEMCSEPLVMKNYQLHVFFGLGSKASAWPENVESTAIGAVLNDASKALKSVFPRVAIKVTATDEPQGVFRVFPSSVVYRLAGDAAYRPPLDLITSALHHHASQLDYPATSQSAYKPLDGRKVRQPQLFVCCHQERDARCGFCGPVLVDALCDELRRRGVVPCVHSCSHIGGHKYAGNVLVFQDRQLKGTEQGVCSGDWYGYVTPDDVSELVDAHFPATSAKAAEAGAGGASLQNGIVVRLWRGGIGLTGEQVRNERRAYADASKAAASSEPAPQSCGAGCKCVSDSA